MENHMAQLNIKNFSRLVAGSRPYARATLEGSGDFSDIRGTIYFYNANPGVLVVAEAFGLPFARPGQAGRQYGPFYGFHLHEGSGCGNSGGDDPFAATGGHYNPTGAPHPFHAGDFPQLLGNSGYAYGSFYSDRLTPGEVVGKTVIIHQHADDFHSQPSGNSGAKIACGVVHMDARPA